MGRGAERWGSDGTAVVLLPSPPGLCRCRSLPADMGAPSVLRPASQPHRGLTSFWRAWSAQGEQKAILQVYLFSRLEWILDLVFCSLWPSISFVLEYLLDLKYPSWPVTCVKVHLAAVSGHSPF